MKFSQFFEMKYLEWQTKQGGRKTVSEFAEWLGIAQTTASTYMHGKRKPEGDTLIRLSEKLGIEIYDSLGLPRPDEDLYYLQSIWDQLPAEARRLLREKGEEYHIKNENSAIRTKRPKTAH